MKILGGGGYTLRKSAVQAPRSNPLRFMFARPCAELTFEFHLSSLGRAIDPLHSRDAVRCLFLSPVRTFLSNRQFCTPEAIEILKKCVSQPVDAIFVCCGGGGMLAGIAAYVKQVRPSVKVYGVEAADAAGMTASLKAGRVVTLPSVGLFADGAAVKTIGEETFRLCDAYVDGMVTVDTDQICNAIKLAYNDA